FRNAVIAWYSRDQINMTWKLRLPTLVDARLVTDGFGRVDAGLLIIAPRARIVFSAEWPVATDLDLTASSDARTRLKIGSGRLFGGVHWFGVMDLPGNGDVASQKIRIPLGDFDSGLNELVFEPESGVTSGVVLRTWAIDDASSHLPPWQAPTQ